ncbi:succinylglutamate desuccinylase/aspartoacylase family protein [Mycolicibacterium farcinogenes]|uniref:Succinylglutamate desuccinylase/aspartoacylase family protein n=1 Tax=Mycolicibacterium farcinogenes TaxID=1802 RepID=A0ACD1FHC6_MYCFR|nr:succinylglutamate desuccinylase/aspartoacylase family protein [Mycolicibacterium farcinogenes]
MVTMVATSCSRQADESGPAAPLHTSGKTLSGSPSTSMQVEPHPVTTETGQTVDDTGWQPIGLSVQSRPIRTRTIGNGPRRVLFVGGIHGDEPEGAYTTGQLASAFTADGLAGLATLTILEDANPDGRAAGTRGNAHGVDINRNFPAANFDAAAPSNGGTPLSQPESRALVETIDRTAPELVLVAHSWLGREFVNFDGPARAIAERFARTAGMPVEESSAFAPTPGSLGSYVGRDRGIAVVTIEVLRGSDPLQVWEKLRPALLEAIRGAQSS